MVPENSVILGDIEVLETFESFKRFEIFESLQGHENVSTFNSLHDQSLDVPIYNVSNVYSILVKNNE